MLKIKNKDKRALLDSSDSEEETVNGNGKVKEELTINKGYADRYDNWRNLEETQKLKNRLGINDLSELKEDESSSESSSEEDDDWSMEKEKAFLKTLACLKTKNPKIYSDQFGFFKGVEEQDGGGNEEKKKKGVKKAFTVRDHERVMVLEKGQKLSDNEEERPNVSKSYPEELASIKTEFSKALKEIDSSDDEGGNLLGSNLLKARANKSEDEKKQEEAEYRLWLKGELDKVEKGKLSKEDEKELRSLRDYWNDDKLDDGEKFLRDYILNKKYIDPNRGGEDYIPTYKEVIHDLSDDEKFEDEREEFEHKYNFRFEEPDQDFIKRYPRTIQESMRREDTSRKDQRQKAKERKEQQKARMKEEVQRLKALKRKEIMSKISKLQEITGDPDLFISEKDIDGDFDPEEHDRRMKEIFNDDFYEEADDAEKPVFEYDEELDGDVDNEEKWENWVPVREKKSSISENEEGAELDDGGSHQVGTITGAVGRKKRKADTEKELIEASKGKRGRRKRSKFLEALEREKPKFDPKVHKSFEEYFEEYYKLDFEDVVGDLKCRFKYHKTTPNNFGLTTEEILKAEDRELNQWASLKKTFQYRGDDEEEYEVKAYKKKGEREDLKKKLLSSVYQQQLDEKEDDENGVENQKKRKKKTKKKKKGGYSDDGNDQLNGLQEVKETSYEEPEIKTEQDLESPRKKKKSKGDSFDYSNGLSEADIVIKEEHVSPKKTKKSKGDSFDYSNGHSEADIVIKEEQVSSKKTKKSKVSSLDKSEGQTIKTEHEVGNADIESLRKKKKRREQIEPSCIKEEIKSPAINKKSYDDLQPKRKSNTTNKTNGPQNMPSKLTKRQRKNLKRVSLPSSNGGSESPAPSSQSGFSDAPPKVDKKHREKNRKRKTFSSDQNVSQLDEDRLQAYGLNPKKFKKQMKYGKTAMQS